MTKIINDLKQLRADLDVLIGMGQQIRGSRETNTAFTKLQEGKMHVGNAIHELNATPIYAESKNATNDKIDPYHVDDLTPIALPVDWSVGNDSPIQNVKIMRRELDLVIARVKQVLSGTYDIGVLGSEHTKNLIDAATWNSVAWIRLREAQNWYGAELGRIRDEAK